MSKTISCQAHRITRGIVETLAELFTDPEFDSDNCVIRFLDRDERRLLLGLFETDNDGNIIDGEPVVTWTIEVAEHLKGGE